jgi:hypothetical protein
MEKEELKGTKIWFGDDKELSRKCQEKLFSIGIAWASSGKEIQNTKDVYIREYLTNA